MSNSKTLENTSDVQKFMDAATRVATTVFEGYKAQEEEKNTSLKKAAADFFKAARKKEVTPELVFADEKDAIEFGKTLRALSKLSASTGAVSAIDLAVTEAYPQKRSFVQRCLSLCFNAEKAHQKADRAEFRKTGTTLARKISPTL